MHQWWTEEGFQFGYLLKLATLSKHAQDITILRGVWGWESRSSWARRCRDYLSIFLDLLLSNYWHGWG